MSERSSFWFSIGLVLVLTALPLSRRCHADNSAASELENKTTAQADPQRELAERILDKTKQARDKLAEKITNDQTHDLQQQVVDDLEKLIDMLKKSPPSNNKNPSPNSNSNSSSSSSSSSNSNRKDQRQQSQQSGQQKSTGAADGQNRAQPQDSEERNGETPEGKNHAERKRKLESDIWGHLPPALREQLLNTYGERMLPQYEEMVRKFYDALSEPSRPVKR